LKCRNIFTVQNIIDWLFGQENEGKRHNFKGKREISFSAGRTGKISTVSGAKAMKEDSDECESGKWPLLSTRCSDSDSALSGAQFSPGYKDAAAYAVRNNPLLGLVNILDLVHNIS
jgi:hypothetical protein